MWHHRFQSAFPFITMALLAWLNFTIYGTASKRTVHLTFTGDGLYRPCWAVSKSTMPSRSQHDFYLSLRDAYQASSHGKGGTFGVVKTQFTVIWETFFFFFHFSTSLKCIVSACWIGCKIGQKTVINCSFCLVQLSLELCCSPQNTAFHPCKVYKHVH